MQIIPLENREAWQKAIDGIPHAFAHTWEHCYAMHLTTKLPTYLYSCERDGIKIVCPFAERAYGEYVDIVKPFGFSGFVGNGMFSEFSLAWSRFAQDRGYVCGYLGLNPIIDYSGHFDPADVHQYDTVYVLDLTPPVEDIFAKLDRNRRRQLKNWNEIRTALVVNKSALETFFIDEYYELLRRKHAALFYHFSKETLSYLIHLENVLLVGGLDSGKVVAATLFAYSGCMGDALFNVSTPEGRHFYAALVWYGVNELKARGVTSINLGGGDSAGYKKRFGCKEFPLRCLKQIYRPEIYEMLCRQAGTDPKGITGIFPAYRAAEFPHPKVVPNESEEPGE